MSQNKIFQKKTGFLEYRSLIKHFTPKTIKTKNGIFQKKMEYLFKIILQYNLNIANVHSQPNS